MFFNHPMEITDIVLLIMEVFTFFIFAIGMTGLLMAVLYTIKSKG